ncbi:MAG TPA: DUF262 domain-containing HNH endonuclease family protein [Ignavibacteria bacterium]|nr:DUF262 domain-containing HNH endonuclease family protein [Ignavibacteria bacterium]
MNIIPNTYNIRQILNSGPYRIPRFQRPFSWQNEQLIDFLDDIFNLIESQETEPLYVGAFVFNNENMRTTGKLEIIDGQQRLISITLLFVAIRDICNELEFDDLKAGIQTNYIEAKDDRNNLYYRIVFHTDSQNDFYDKYFLKIDHDNLKRNILESVEAKNIYNAYKYFYDRIKNHLKSKIYKKNDEKYTFLEKLRDTITNILAVAIEVDSEEVAYQVFETLNSKGLTLSQTDLLKNLILKKYRPERELDRAKMTWDTIISNLEKLKLQPERFVRYYWLSKYKFISGKYLYKSIKREITNYKSLLSELLTESEVYAIINTPNKENFSKDIHSNEIFESLKLLKLIGIQQCDPLMLSMFRAYKSKRISKSQLKNTIKLIENFSFLFRMAGKNPSGIERTYSKFAILTQNCKDGNEFDTKVLKELKKTFKEKKPTYDEFEAPFLKLNFLDDRGLCFVILDRINRKENNQNNLNLFNFTLEHILSDNPDSCWNLTAEQIREYVHLIGNLTLLENELNVNADNKCIKDKIKYYKDSEYKMTRKLKKLKEWNQNTINDRSITLAKYAYMHIWKV